MSIDAAAIAEPDDAAVGAAHEVVAADLAGRASREDVVVAVNGEGRLQIAAQAQPAVLGGQLDHQLFDVIGCAVGRAPPHTGLRRAPARRPAAVVARSAGCSTQSGSAPSRNSSAWPGNGGRSWSW